MEDELIEAVFSADHVKILRLVEAGVDLNSRCHDGASVLFGACLAGDIKTVQLLLDHGADPNLFADESTSTFFNLNPLGLVMQAQGVWGWDKFLPIYDLLIEHGATDIDGTVPTEDMHKRRETNIRQREL